MGGQSAAMAAAAVTATATTGVLDEGEDAAEAAEAEQVAAWLFELPGLSPKQLGSVLAAPAPFNVRVLACFMRRFRFGGLRIDEPLRPIFSCIAELLVLFVLVFVLALVLHTNTSMETSANAIRVYSYHVPGAAAHLRRASHAGRGTEGRPHHAGLRRRALS